MLLTATLVWWLVLVSGTEGTGYTMQPIARTETQATCEDARVKWIVAYPDLAGMPKRLKCVQIDQKSLEWKFWP